MQSVIVEVRPRLQVCNVFLMVKEHIVDKNSVKLDMNPSYLEVSWESEMTAVIQKIYVGNEKWKFMSISAVEIHKNAITFRVQTVPLHNSSGSYSLELLPFSPDMDMMRGSIKRLSPCICAESESPILCKCCGYSVSKHNTKFTRILPLPSSSWSKTDWFCHKHAESPDYQNMPLLPKTDDCFYGSCFVVINSSLLKISSTNKVIVCKRCLAWLGKNEGDSVKLWNCTVNFGRVSQSTALEDFINVIAESVHESVSIICKLLMYTQLTNETFHYLLMWIMDKDLDVLLGVNDKSVEYSFSDGQNKPVQMLQCVVNKHKTIKVLYKYQKDCSDTVKLWQSDIHVQYIEIAKQMFLSGMDHLVSGMQYLPLSHRVVNNFYVSYIGLK